MVRHHIAMYIPNGSEETENFQVEEVEKVERVEEVEKVERVEEVEYWSN